MGDAVKRKKVGWGVCLREECLFAGGSVTIDSFQGICIDEGYLIMYYPDDWSIILIENADILVPSPANIMVIQP
jgi:hypothetical protein